MHIRIRSALMVACTVLILTVTVFTCCGQEYTLIFKNLSSNIGDVCVYQYDPGMDAQGVMSLAWFAKGAAPTTTLRFCWTLEYCFVWSETGRLTPGAVFKAEQVWEVKDMATENRVDFKMTQDRVKAYTFANQKAGPNDKDLFVVGDGTLPVKEAMVGIGMAGAPTFVVPAQPNTSWIFTPAPPRYWITFGTFEHGEVLDVESITYRAEEVVYEHGVFSMTAILNRDNTWTIFPTSEANVL